MMDEKNLREIISSDESKKRLKLAIKTWLVDKLETGEISSEDVDSLQRLALRRSSIWNKIKTLLIDSIWYAWYLPGISRTVGGVSSWLIAGTPILGKVAYFASIAGKSHARKKAEEILTSLFRKSDKITEDIEPEIYADIDSTAEALSNLLTRKAKKNIDAILEIIKALETKQVDESTEAEVKSKISDLQFRSTLAHLIADAAKKTGLSAKDLQFELETTGRSSWSTGTFWHEVILLPLSIMIAGVSVGNLISTIADIKSPLTYMALSMQTGGLALLGTMIPRFIKKHKDFKNMIRRSVIDAFEDKQSEVIDDDLLEVAKKIADNIIYHLSHNIKAREELAGMLEVATKNESSFHKLELNLNLLLDSIGH